MRGNLLDYSNDQRDFEGDVQYVKPSRPLLSPTIPMLSLGFPRIFFVVELSRVFPSLSGANDFGTAPAHRKEVS